MGNRSKISKIPKASWRISLKVLVGPEETEFLVPKAAICIESGYFKAACNENWESGKKNVVRLAEEDPSFFNMFLTYMCTGDVNNCEDSLTVTVDANKIEDHREPLEKKINQLAKCFILGDFLLAEKFKNHIMDLIYWNSKYHLTTHGRLGLASGPIIQDIWESTLTGSPLRQFVLDTVASFAGGERVVEFDCPDFFFELSRTLLRQRNHGSKMTPYDKDLCIYHRHEDIPLGFSCS